jgi:hypothetical protein
MKPLFSGEFCPNDCDRQKLASWVDELLKHIRPGVRKMLVSMGWFDCAEFILTYREEGPVYAFYPEVDFKPGGVRKAKHDDMLRADWAVAVRNGQIEVLKNRWGTCSLGGLPVYERT